MIKDSASAEAAKPRLKALGIRWRENERRRAQMKLIPKREMASLDQKYGAQLESALKRYFAEVARVQRVPSGDNALRELGEVKGQPQLRKKKEAMR